jgi:hypothetical protein
MAVDVGDRPTDVLRRRGADPAEQKAVFRVPYFQEHVGGLPLAFEEGAAGKASDFCPAVPCFRARVSEGFG